MTHDTWLIQRKLNKTKHSNLLKRFKLNYVKIILIKEKANKSEHAKKELTNTCIGPGNGFHLWLCNELFCLKVYRCGTNLKRMWWNLGQFGKKKEELINNITKICFFLFFILGKNNEHCDEAKIESSVKPELNWVILIILMLQCWWSISD